MELRHLCRPRCSREFTAIGRAQTTLWTRARGLDYLESKELLALVGTYEEKARGYVERIRMEYIALRGGNGGFTRGIEGRWASERW